MVRKHSANYRGETAYIMGIKCSLYCCGLDVDQEKTDGFVLRYIAGVIYRTYL